MAEKQTYDDFLVKQIMPAEGWQSVWYMDEDGAHSLLPVYALALAYRVTRECHTSRIVPPGVNVPQEELWEIVGLIYDPGEPWAVCDTISNFCGLLPPGMPRETFMKGSLCRHVHPAVLAVSEMNGGPNA